jgi:aspartate-semialdehyde dehydrogenase
VAWDKTLPERPVVAVAGVTGAVGREMLEVLEERDFPAARVVALASSRSVGREIPFKGGTLVVEELTGESFADVDVALFSAGGSVSKEMAPQAVARGCLVIDNSSAFRMDDAVPLVVPEVNGADIAGHSGIIANPNCSTIQMVVVLGVLRELAPLRRVVAATYQAASGAGRAAMDELFEQTGDYLGARELHIEEFSHRIAFNCIPHIDVFMDDGSTREEWKMVVETRKIMGEPDLAVTATCVRVPVLRCHSEALFVEFERPVDVEDARATLEAAGGVSVLDDPDGDCYPMPALLERTDDVYVGRLRNDPSVEAGVQLWCVADQLRKGAALNAVQIAEALLG